MIEVHLGLTDKNEAYKRFKRCNVNSQHFQSFQSLQSLLGVSIETSKQILFLFIKEINGSIHKSQNILGSTKVFS